MSNSLYRKWRPQSFDDLKGQDVIRDTLMYALTHNQISHAYLFCGPRGTGKTTTARLVAKAINCQTKTEQKPCNQCPVCLTITAGTNLDVIELDGASNRGIDEIRGLRESVKYPPLTATYKVFIIDEVHMLTREAFNALLKSLEEPPKHAVFILATTEAHKVPATVLSRVQRYDFRLAPIETLAALLTAVAQSEDIKLTDDAALFLAKLAEGSFRDSLSLLDQVRSSDHPQYTVEVLESILGYVPRARVASFLTAVVTGHHQQAFQLLDNCLEQGADLRAFGDQVLGLSQEALEAVILGKVSPIQVTFESRRIVDWIECWADALMKSKSSPIARLPLDVAIAKFASSTESSINNPEPIHEIAPEIVIASSQTVGRGNLKLPETDAQTVEIKSDESSKPKIVTLETGGEPAESRENGVSVPVVTEVPEHISAKDWLKMLETIKQDAPSLLASLAHARVMHIEHDIISLAVPYKMHAEKINSPKNRSIVETAISGVLQVPMAVVAEVNKKAAKQADDMVDVAEVFELEL